MPTTSRGYRYPAASSAPNVPLDLGNLAADVDADIAALIAWTDYTPTWTAATTNPVAGANATLYGRYQQIGKRITYVGYISMGNTTTYGSGAWLISLPVTAKTVATVQALYPGSAYLFDNSVTANRQPAAAVLYDTTHLFLSTMSGSAAATVPFTWATSDAAHWSITYEAA
ncbi:MAG TPA: hypothetical protein VFX60_19320 [Micromonospora sp.]|nr:hypothetical protein [Micromonospora sp.]